ncbi:hypothetical protein K458DRAFT_253092, partial [Lentithecium fluviatile CBS 122367]
IETSRLVLIRMHDTSPKSQHLQWLHKCWSDEALMSWNIHGASKTLQESRDFLTDHLTMDNALLYTIFSKPSTRPFTPEDPGELVGQMSLKIRAEPTLPPPPWFASPIATTSDQTQKPLNTRHLGYAFFQSAWGKGYATEAGQALLSAYAASIAEKKKEGKETHYMEAIWGRKNPASGRVLMKLGFKEVGWKVLEEGAFLGGEWQEPGYWVYGMYL